MGTKKRQSSRAALKTSPKHDPYKAVCAELPNLTSDQLLQVKARIEFLASGSTTKVVQRLTSDQMLLYGEVVALLRRRHNPFIHIDEGKISVPRLKGFNYRDFRDAYEVVQTFIDGVGTDRRIKAYRVIIDAVEEYIVTGGLGANTAVSIITVTEGLRHTYDAMEAAFPGYMGSGLTKIVLLG